MDCFKMRGLMFSATLLVSAAFALSGCGGGGGAAVPSDGPPGTIVVSVANPEPIKNTAYGQNYWCWATGYGNPIAGTESQGAALKLNVIRAGGYNNDAQTPNAWNQSEVDRYIAYCRAIGAEPIFQVSLINGTKEDAANWVDYCNNVKHYQVKYWIIGNEPDLYAGKDKPSTYDVNSYCADFKAYAAAMKAKDSTIKVMGPELSWKYQIGDGANDWWTPFLQQCHDDVDIVTFHRYPFAPQDCTVENAMGDHANLRTLVRRLRSVVDTYCGTDRPMAITEANITYDGTPSLSNKPASPQTFYAGLWVADTMGVALEEKLWTMAYWSFTEGWTIGFLDGSTKQPKPVYYGLYMYTNYFGNALIHPTQVPSGLSVYASRNPGNDKTVLMVINKTNTNLPETIQINDLASPVSKEHVFPAYSITCITIPDDGGPMDIWTYASGQSVPGHTGA